MSVPAGTIPPQLNVWLPALTAFECTGCELHGPIPTTLFALTALRELTVHDAKLDGTLPSEIGAAPALASVTLDLNELSGTLPAELAALPATFERLYLAGNRFHGPIPPLPNLVDAETPNMCSLFWPNYLERERSCFDCPVKNKGKGQGGGGGLGRSVSSS